MVPFSIHNYTPATLAVSATTGRLAIPTSLYPARGRLCVWLYSVPGLSDCFFIPGNSGVEAAATNVPLPTGGWVLVELRPSDTHIAFICASGGTATVYCTVGESVRA